MKAKRNSKGRFVKKSGKSGSASPAKRSRRRRRRGNPSAPASPRVIQMNPAPAARRRRRRSSGKAKRRRATASAGHTPKKRRKHKRGRRRNAGGGAAEVAISLLAGAVGVVVGTVGGRLIDAKVPLGQMAKSAIQIGLGTGGAVLGAMVGGAPGAAAGLGFGGAMAVPSTVRAFDAIVPLDTTAPGLPGNKFAELSSSVQANLAGLQRLRAGVSPFQGLPPARMGMAPAV